VPLLSYLPKVVLSFSSLILYFPSFSSLPPPILPTYLPAFPLPSHILSLPPPHLFSNSLPFFIYLLTIPSFHIPLPSFHSYFLPSFIFLYSSSSLLPSSLSIPYFHASLFRSFITFFNFFILHPLSFHPSFLPFLHFSRCLSAYSYSFSYIFLPSFLSLSPSYECTTYTYLLIFLQYNVLPIYSNELFFSFLVPSFHLYLSFITRLFSPTPSTNLIYQPLQF
jgi:hypothetical protein